MVFKDILRQRAKKSQSTKILEKINYNEVIVSPILVEKSLKLQESMNKYTFEVDSRANKNDVKVAVRLIYGVDPEKINIVVVPYKGRFQKKLVRREYKKAIITLKQGEKIEIVK